MAMKSVCVCDHCNKQVEADRHEQRVHLGNGMIQQNVTYTYPPDWVKLERIDGPVEVVCGWDCASRHTAASAAKYERNIPLAFEGAFRADRD